jgi:hypothetical protein
MNHVPATTTAANGSANDAHASGGALDETDPEHRHHETPPASEHHPGKGENS